LFLSIISYCRVARKLSGPTLLCVFYRLLWLCQVLNQQIASEVRNAIN
jgi:hypothetical protein